jgi:CubicO group peptidase (beta-lactamase class C family)
LGYAIVCKQRILEMNVLGQTKAGTDRAISTNQHFRMGSNTKAVTGLIAAQLVEKGKIDWETKFFEMFPEWKKHSPKAYHELTLLSLLTFRNWLPQWSYMMPKPDPSDIQGDAISQRMHFMQWAFRQKPVHIGEEYNHSNLGYVAAGLMLEQASGLSYEQLVADLGKKLDITFGFGQPNANDSLAMWGHDAQLHPEPPSENARLNWLMAAGNLTIALDHYALFLQFQLQGLAGESDLLAKEQFDFLHFGLPDFSVGWFNGYNSKGQHYSHNLGNPGSFLCRTMVVPEADRAYIVFTNCMTDGAYAGTELLMDRLGE